jgi:plastocyanin
MRLLTASVIVAFSLCAWGCDNDTDRGPVSPTAPAAPALPPPPTPTPTPPPGGTVTIDVLGVNGAQSFSPNPATLPADQTVVWHHVDSITHRIVLNDGSFDTLNLNPGASSQPMTINVPSAGHPYHCSIHPSMVGTLVAPASATLANITVR